jgi:crossover junction endodeoxyribonuclease RuvC
MPNKGKGVIILAIDPGYERLGIAVLEKKAGQRENLIHSECFKTSAKIPHHERLTIIGKKIKEIIEKYKPILLATEKLFFSKNQKTALLVAESRGVILFSANYQNLDVFEYTPADIKIAITGYGKSEKQQIISMVKKLIKIEKKTNSDDEFDAIAIGLTHFARHRDLSTY